MNDTTLNKTLLTLDINPAQLDDNDINIIIKSVVLDLSNTAQTYTKLLASWNHGSGTRIGN
ncbi:MAG: hypothetical protein LBC17_02255 [Lactobacillaceae bacterium]|jgi:hypothetical protein|nr:hypothetical protein [Lactobacillaceae bacterium]